LIKVSIQKDEWEVARPVRKAIVRVPAGLLKPSPAPMFDGTSSTRGYASGA